MKNKEASDLQNYLDIDIASQQLTVYANGNRVRCYPVSTAKKGAGELMGSECTPTGWHKSGQKLAQINRCNCFCRQTRYRRDLQH